ncbi:hypothetical protein [Amycolatopsis sp. cmx-4-68]|uniref:hypothetical protein n=1 Tax=Amycolatopsis sp. cmx-4-68 TaxID=2790938 RepID=UPI00397804D7
MITDVFFADAPRPELAERLAVFAPLVGSWSLVVENVRDDGTADVTDGEWHFGWALDGRALADVWISPSRATRAATGTDGEWGMSLRFHDPAIDAFRSTWLGPGRGWVIPFVGTPTSDGFRIDSEDRSWIFSELTADSFEWRAEETAPGAPAPRVRQRFHARRVTDGQATA